MNKSFTGQPVLNLSKSADYGDVLLNELKAGTPSAFSKLYDQYAAILFGVITEIIQDEHEAIRLLEATFAQIQSQINQFQPARQPLFPWLLTIARTTATDALKRRKMMKSSRFQLTPSGQVTGAQSHTADSSTSASMQSLDWQLKELLDKVLFRNCTPEEAASSLGIPVALARQQLRLAMQQLRASQNLN